ncbi:MAG: NADH:ubiquinone reductase (Na(+)-transporting) subunit C [Flavobacteriales bacterium]|nr:NADH:ubiquinone reductase (Na(+)-transporting) subunit C [Flavobacteriales bacterium]
MTLILGSALAFVSEGLKDKQQAEREFERKKFILSAALGTEAVNQIIATEGREKVNNIYESRVRDLVVDSDGKTIEGKRAGDVIVAKEYKKLVRVDEVMQVKSGEQLNLPVYTIAKENGEGVEYYVLPIYGFGLWDNIWGYLAIQSDFNTVQGAIFDHKGETPGLGARITETAVQQRYSGKKLYDASGALVSVVMQKGEGADYSGDPHKVNGMTGATITGVGLNNMVKDYVGLYSNYLNSLKQ